MRNALLFLVASAALVIANPAAAEDPLPHSPKQAQGGFTPPKPKEGYRYPDCFCTDSEGKRVEIGQMTCLQIGSTQVLARCAMSLNNPAWRRVSEGCPSV